MIGQAIERNNQEDVNLGNYRERSNKGTHCNVLHDNNITDKGDVTATGMMDHVAFYISITSFVGSRDGLELQAIDTAAIRQIIVTVKVCFIAQYPALTDLFSPTPTRLLLEAF